jgi:hypothetical protein
MSEIRTVMIETTIRVPMKNAGDHDHARDRVVIEISLHGRQQLSEGIQRDQRGGAPGRDRQDLAHEAAHHREQAGDQHHGEQERDRVSLSASAGQVRIKSSKPRIGTCRCRPK